MSIDSREVGAEKVCSKCSVSKPVGEFRVGHNQCKKCNGKMEKEYYRSDKGRALKAITAKKYRGSEKGKAYHLLYSRKYKRENTKKWYMRCKNMVTHSICAGRMPSAFEASCEQESKLCNGRHEYHHDSYKKQDWLKVRALCRYHHMEWHKSHTADPYEEPGTITAEQGSHIEVPYA